MSATEKPSAARLDFFKRLSPEEAGAGPHATLTLPFEKRSKSRLLATLDDGREVGLFLERGIILRHGDCLAGEEGTVIQIVAAPEPVSKGRASSPLNLARACYHLGNRHMPLQVGDGWLQYQADHVLDEMVRGLGLEVVAETQPFEPEGGAYSEGHSHGHSHEHSHDHTHEHGDH